MGKTSYDPTPEQIAEACERIRAGWSEAELRRRGAWAYQAEVIEYRPVTVRGGNNSNRTNARGDV